MTAIEAMARDDRNRRMENLIREHVQLQYECQKIAEPFHALINDVYARSTFTVTFIPGGPLIRPTYPPETEAMVAKIQEEARKAIAAHVDMYERRRNGLAI
jgi:hypothetical protein